eukprot:CAMPEP_0174336236 /NCGR_PEP_ID=MMETSP0810-20121108/21414_1 /TAXON_ID=73025 ORGANISM="Eutreptiella gymnastica-like, Strain CCMP1594" /NCGR_SAMPLE_ID=MMETSP0810 /ASSEMBLY_ACC=CAM_ASM_000659 /LENGTH=102 /DNA_ID=CAMNT_0015455079 /DNA_START=123 /DNA_END=429 /DNA_ORIENTATION=-
MARFSGDRGGAELQNASGRRRESDMQMKGSEDGVLLRKQADGLLVAALSSTAHTPKDRLSLAGAGVWGACCIVVARPNGPDATVATRSLADAPPVPPLLHDL